MTAFETNTPTQPVQPIIVDAVSFDHQAHAAATAAAKPLFDRLNCRFEAGSFSALVGPSGCGKSSLLRLLAGLAVPQNGAINRGDHAAVGFVFQEPTLLAWRNVRANIALPLKLSGLAQDAIDRRVSDALALVGLHERADALPRQLSGGQKMRVSLARALAAQPQLLLLDEPFAALDELTRFRLDDDLRAIWQAQGCTIVFVTHSVTEAAYLAERVLVMTGAGHLAADIAIAGQAARQTGGNFRAAPDFHTACDAISNALGHNMQGGA